MAETATNFPPQTYSSSFFLNSPTNEEKHAAGSSSVEIASGRRSKNTSLLDCFISTIPSFVLLVLLVFHCREVKAMECAVPNEPRTRIFDSIAHYQGNNLPFSVLNGGWAGSIVEFNFSTINRLPKNMFISYDSGSIIVLNLRGKKIVQVDAGAFISLYCLHELLLDHNNIAKLPENAFQGLNNLLRLDLTANNLDGLKNWVFADLFRLKFLNLAQNKIKIIESKTFENLTSVEYLNLEFNEIKIVGNDVFKPLLSLKRLILAFNKLHEIEPEKWSGLNRLDELNLAGNSLNHFDPGYNFSFTSLKTLNLSSNTLTYLNALAFPQHLPHLGLLDLRNNSWYCDDLRSMIQQLQSSRIKIPSDDGSVGSGGEMACRRFPVFSTRNAETSTVSVTTTKTETAIDKRYLEAYVEKKLEGNNEKLMSSIHDLRTLIIFLFVLLCIFIGFEICMRLNWCRSIVRHFRGSNETYFDDSSNLRLLQR